MRFLTAIHLNNMTELIVIYQNRMSKADNKCASLGIHSNHTHFPFRTVTVLVIQTERGLRPFEELHKLL
jgi:hypothetical protein